MIHLTGIALIAAGAGLGSLPLASLRQKIQSTRHEPDSQNLAQHQRARAFRRKATALRLHETARQRRLRAVHARFERNHPPHLQLDAEQATTLVPADGDSGRSPWQFPVMSGMLGLSVVAQFTFPVLIPVTLVAIGYLSATIYQEAFEAIFKKRKVHVDILDATVITLCVLFGQIAAAGFMVWILDIADLLLEKTRNRSKRFLTDIFGTQARTAWLLLDGQEMEVEVKTLHKGDVIVVNTGEQVPIDGRIVHGQAMIDQHSLTGEAAPVEKHHDDPVFATTVMVAGKIHVEVQQTGADTLASKIVQIINEASEFKVDLQSLGERTADRMVIPTLSLGTLGLFTAGPGGMLAIINADYGTGIRVAAPIALLASLGRAAKHGVLIKDSQVFETLRDIDVVLFDKTGTLTHDVPSVAEIVPAGPEFPEEKILLYTATAEQKFSHPIARAILHKAQERGLSLAAHDDSRYHVGFGIEVMIQGERVRVGSARYMEQEKLTIPTVIQQALDSTRARGHSAILIAIDEQVAGLVELQATVREEAVQVMQTLRARGIQEIALISGDHDAPTRELAQQLGVDRYFAQVLPHEKADHVRLLQAEGKKVMMVGDGINDSAALSLADIAISLQGASTIAVDVADVVFMDGNLEKFAYLFEASDVLRRNVRRSFAMIAIPNTVCILGGLTGYFGLAASLVLNNGFNFIAAVNGSLAYREAAGVEQDEKRAIIN